MIEGLVSVIVPVYNVEKYVRECLDSILAQTYQSYEVIMVDDGSTDASGRICDEYEKKDSRFRVLHRENGGLSAARNTGLEASEGEFVYFLDSDDWIKKEALNALVQKAKETGADFVFFDGSSFEDSGKGYDIPQGYTRKTEYLPDSGLNVFDSLQKNGDFKAAAQTYFWRRSFLESCGLRFYPGILYEDMLFSFEAFCRADLAAHCHERFFQRRYRVGSIMTQSFSEKNFYSADIMRKRVLEIAAENNCESRGSVKQYIVRCSMRPIEIYQKLSPSEKRSCKKKYQSVIDDIRKAKGYGSKALYYRTYGKILWAIIKASEKIKRR